MPVTIPVVLPTVALSVLLLVHVPPPASVRLVVNPTHTVDVPVIAAGNGLMETVTLPSVLQQPDEDLALK